MSNRSAALIEEPYRQTFEAVLRDLGSDLRTGLSQEEAQRRLGRYGRNELDAAPARPQWLKLLAQLSDVLVLLLIAAAAVSAVIWWLERDTSLPYEALAIFAIVIANALMGYIQESRAERAAAALRQLSATCSNVIRDGSRMRIDAAELVPGDIILVGEGDTIPADARLARATALQTVEAGLTGESTPVVKDVAALTSVVEPGDQHSMIFSGTTAVYGHGCAIVTATGMRTMMGRIAGMLQQQPQEATPLQRELGRVGKALAVIVVLIAAVMIGTLLHKERVDSYAEAFDVLIVGVALAVAAVPEGLPAVVTAVLSVGETSKNQSGVCWYQTRLWP
jgi:Ca2+-transporting ATPase